MLSCRFWGIAAVVCAVCFYRPALADDSRSYMERGLANPEERAALVEEGRGAAVFCFNCHGENGNSLIPLVPNLAEQHPIYLMNQIEAFLNGKRRDDFMEGLMRALDARERAAVALYFSQSGVTPAMSEPGPRAAEGKVLFEKICAECHHADASGGEKFPRLAGQQPEYLRINLGRYLTGSQERFSAEMTSAARRLGERNIDAIVDYLGSLETK